MGSTARFLNAQIAHPQCKPQAKSADSTGESAAIIVDFRILRIIEAVLRGKSLTNWLDLVESAVSVDPTGSANRAIGLGRRVDNCVHYGGIAFALRALPPEMLCVCGGQLLDKPSWGLLRLRKMEDCSSSSLSETVNGCFEFFRRFGSNLNRAM